MVLIGVTVFVLRCSSRDWALMQFVQGLKIGNYVEMIIVSGRGTLGLVLIGELILRKLFLLLLRSIFGSKALWERRLVGLFLIVNLLLLLQLTISVTLILIVLR